MTGTLYVVATPIGNLEDITYRAVRILREVAIIAAEDTRHTQRLLRRYNINALLTSYHDFNKEAKTPVLISRMQEGDSIAIVSDAGTPTISDPGYYLIKAAVLEGLCVSPIPGPSSAIAALSASGLPTDRFAFEGFLPRKKGKRATRLLYLLTDPRTLIFFESPYRIRALLEEISSIFGDRRVAVGRELTKIYEEMIYGTITEVIEKIGSRKLKGEITILIEGYHEKKKGIPGFLDIEVPEE
ncbi:MAG: 16S rRNA (cytidine(1402)-2'-O)-methyltransferase [Nitrospira sp.]|nr:16S rRNA (cytidine(1402)-2'-O)-methyltransferase [Candidatus Manganitrophaceae bacterium]HIL34407.1 16S rRNA (cytidine(1402)-2'-O)-methyltransferase [Candidatus Manganitrophaceae bacterium]